MQAHSLLAEFTYLVPHQPRPTSQTHSLKSKSLHSSNDKKLPQSLVLLCDDQFSDLRQKRNQRSLRVSHDSSERADAVGFTFCIFQPQSQDQVRPRLQLQMRAG